MDGIIFDCDGVLVDSEQWSCSAWLPVLQRRGIAVELPDIEAFIGQSDQALLAHYSRQTGLKLDLAEIIAEREHEYFALAQGRLQTFAGLREVLEALAQRRMPLAVASSGRPGKIRFSLEQTGLAVFFPVVCSITHVARGKPAPDLFLLAAARLGLPPECCAVIEDSVPGIQAARRAQMHALGFTSSHPAAVLEAAGAHQTFASYQEILALLT